MIKFQPEDRDTFEALKLFGFGGVAITNAFVANKDKKLQVLLDWLLKNEDSSLSKANLIESKESNAKFEEKKS